MSATVESSTIRIGPQTKAILRELAKNEGSSMQAVLEAAVERYQRDQFLDAVNAAYARLRENPEAWAEELAERKISEGTLLDGLEDD